MDQLFEFAANHALLVAAALALTALLIGGEIRHRVSGVREVTPAMATRLLSHDNAVMVDMRAEKDYREGHIVNAVHVPDALANTGKFEKFREQPIIVCCRSGQQSGNVCRQLQKQGYETVYNLKGGVHAWKQAELPLKKGK